MTAITSGRRRDRAPSPDAVRRSGRSAPATVPPPARGRHDDASRAPRLADRAGRRVTAAVAHHRQEVGRGRRGRHHHLPRVPEPRRGLQLLSEADVARSDLVHLRRRRCRWRTSSAPSRCSASPCAPRPGSRSATSQLAGNAISLIVPGGAAVGAATQFRMLAASGNDTATAVGGLTAFSLLGIGGLLALPIFVLPAILAGTPIASGLEDAALLGIVAFFLFAGFGAVVLVARRADALGRPRRAVGAQPLLRKRGADDRPARPARARAQPHPRRAGHAVEGGHAAQQRSAGLRLRDPPRHASGPPARSPTRRWCSWPTPWPDCSRSSRSRRAASGIVEAGLSGLLILAGVPGRRRRRGHVGLPDHLVLAARSSWGRSRTCAFRLRYGPPGHGRERAGAGGRVRRTGGGRGTGVACKAARVRQEFGGRRGLGEWRRRSRDERGRSYVPSDTFALAEHTMRIARRVHV